MEYYFLTNSKTTFVTVNHIPNGPALGKTPYSKTTFVTVNLGLDYSAINIVANSKTTFVTVNHV